MGGFCVLKRLLAAIASVLRLDERLSRFPRERRGPPPKAVGGEDLDFGLGKTLTSQAFGLGPSSPVRTGEEFGLSLPPQQHPGLGGDLGEHGGGGDRRVADAFDDPAELLHPGALRGDPLVDRLGRLAPALPVEEVEAELLEVAGEAGGQQPLPLVARLEVVRRTLRPIESQ